MGNDMTSLSDLRLSKNMKYTALYWAMRFYEYAPDLYRKEYKNGTCVEIDAEKQTVFTDKTELSLNTHESFVVLELLDRLFSLGYTQNDIHVAGARVQFRNFTVYCHVWDDAMDYPVSDREIAYKSRLVSGVLEYQSKIRFAGKNFDYGAFEEYDTFHFSVRKRNQFSSQDFIYCENRLMKYTGKEKAVVIPDGTEEIESSAFWDNQFIEEVVIPDTVVNLGGDTFYNCRNLQTISIPKNVRFMGNNPFAGCPHLKLKNQSPFFVYENGILYNREKDSIIYCSIIGNEAELKIPEGVKIIGKHAFYLCDRFEKITLPASLLKMENNPFSGCSKLELICASSAYNVKDDVIYNRYNTAVVGVLNKIKTERLVIPEGVKTINRNSFWNCKGIQKIVFPKTLEDIGYNPFVGCSSICFESNSPCFMVKDDVLYNHDGSKLICYPAWKATGEVYLPDSVITLERGAFSGCDKMTAIHLHNVNVINKSCFTNCTALQKVYCSDLITYIGEWAFAYCCSLNEISVGKDTIIDNNAFSNASPKIKVRETPENYLIESDNIYTLAAMQKHYRGMIDAILIDPPYNSNIDYIGYQDVAFENGYLGYMYERLQKAYPILSEKGFMVINIDEGEVANLMLLCKKIFGAEMVSLYRWKKKNPLFDQNRVVLNPNKVQTDYEYIIVCKKSSASILKNIRQPYLDNGVWKETDVPFPDDFDCFGTTSSAKDEIADIFGKREYFSTPKPVKLIKELIRATTDKSSIIMDFFAGSGTLGQAVKSLNDEDCGTRSFILVNNRESNICRTVTKKRLESANVKFKFLY